MTPLKLHVLPLFAALAVAGQASSVEAERAFRTKGVKVQVKGNSTSSSRAKPRRSVKNRISALFSKRKATVVNLPVTRAEMTRAQIEKAPALMRGIRRLRLAYGRLWQEHARFNPNLKPGVPFKVTKVEARVQGDQVKEYHLHVSYDPTGYQSVSDTIVVKADGTTAQPLFGVGDSVFGTTGSRSVSRKVAQAAKEQDAKALRPLDSRSRRSVDLRVLTSADVRNVSALRSGLKTLNRVWSANQQKGKLGLRDVQAHYKDGKLTHYTATVLGRGRRYATDVTISPAGKIRSTFLGKGSVFPEITPPKAQESSREPALQLSQ